MCAATTLIHCGKLFDGITETLQPNVDILIRGNRIEEVGRGLHTPSDAEVIDLSQLTVTPGMIDAHVHPDLMESFVANHSNPYSMNDAYCALAAARTAEKALRRGFTTLRAAGAFGCCGYVFHNVRAAIEQGYYIGARMVISQGCCTPGSHGDYVKSLGPVPELIQDYGQRHVCMGNGPEFFRAALREQRRLGYDFAKIMATGGFATEGDSPVDQQLGDDELQMIMATAHELGMGVTAHAYFPALVTKLAEFGIDGIEHAALIDKTTATLLEQKDVYVVPTFMPYEPVVHWDEERMKKKTVAAQKKYRYYQEQFVEGRKVLVESNIRLGYGTDIVAQFFPYESGYEYEAWLNSGIDPYRALKAATSVNAGICQRPQIGTIAPGQLADIAGWKRDLLKDPKALLDCAFVMKDSVCYETESNL